MNITTKCHLKALGDTVELSLCAGVTAIVADLVWLTHDILSNGLSAVYSAVATGLLLGLIITAIALWNYHKTLVTSTLKQHYVNKKKRMAAKLKYYKKHL